MRFSHCVNICYHQDCLGALHRNPESDPLSKHFHASVTRKNSLFNSRLVWGTPADGHPCRGGGGAHALPKFNEKATEIRQSFEQKRLS